VNDFARNQATSGHAPAPWDILKSRDALLEAAKLNRQCIEQMNEFGEAHPQSVQLAQSLATYALAVDRWSP
jgi:hypothetical protein